MPSCSLNCYYSSFTLPPKYKSVVTHKLFRNYVDYNLSTELQLSIFALLGPWAAPESITGVLTLILRHRRPVSSPTGNDATMSGSARVGTGGLPRSGQSANPAPSGSIKMVISIAQQGRVYKKVSFVQNQGNLVAAFLFPTFSF